VVVYGNGIGDMLVDGFVLSTAILRAPVRGGAHDAVAVDVKVHEHVHDKSR
jgi:hypothetical protein